MGEKLCLNVPFWSISKILKTVAATLTQLHVREENTHGFLPFLFENIYPFIDLNTSLSYIRMVIGEKLSLNLLIFHNFAKIQIINTSLIFVYELS